MTESQTPVDYVYILGSGASGSTLLELLLAGHPRMAPMGEIEKLSLQFARGQRGRCSCGECPAACPVWRAVADAVRYMVQAVQEREEQLREEVAQLRIQIDESKREEQVSEITETDYFQDLTQHAESLRKRRTSKRSG